MELGFLNRYMPIQTLGGKIDGLVKEPTGTEVLFDIIDASSGELIDGYTNLTLPIDLLFNPSEINSIQVKAKLSSNNQFVTPSIEKIEMGVASYFDGITQPI